MKGKDVFKAIAYTAVLGVATYLFLETRVMVKRMDALNELSQPPAHFLGESSAPVVAAQPAQSQAQSAPAPAPALAPVPAPTNLPVVVQVAATTGYAPPNRQTTGPRYTNANLIPGGTPPKAPADTSPPHLIIDVGKLDPRAALHDRRLNCTEISPGRISCAQ